MARRTAAQLARRRQVEQVIRVLSPLFDVVLFAGEQLSRVVGRNEVAPEPARHPRTSIAGPSPGTEGPAH